MLEKQRQFNQQAVAFHLASFIRMRQNEQTIKELEETLAELDHRLLGMTDETRKGAGA